MPAAARRSKMQGMSTPPERPRTESTAPLRFHFDYISPYAYLAWHRIHEVAARHGRAVEPVPVLFAGPLDAWGQKGPAEIAPKRVYVFKDALRNATQLGLPFAAPPAHPFNPLLALRVTCLDMHPDQRRALIDRLFAAVWGDGPGVTDREVVAALALASGLDGHDSLAAAETPEIKERLRVQTARAVEEGVFGVPTIVADGEHFWGLDSLPHLERLLRGEDPATPERIARWRHVPAGAHRPGGLKSR